MNECSAHLEGLLLALPLDAEDVVAAGGALERGAGVELARADVVRLEALQRLAAHRRHVRGRVRVTGVRVLLII